MKSLNILIILFILAIGVNAATFVVNNTSDVQDATAGDGICATAGAVCTLRAAITEANALAGADIITLPAGTYTITIAEASDNANANGDFDITSDITINGAGSGTTFVEAATAPGVAIGRVFHIRGLAAANTIVANLNGMTIRNGRYPNNTFVAGVRVDQGTNHNVTLDNVIVSGNLNASTGGGVGISGATTPTLTISNSTITGNGAGSNVAGTGANGAGLFINSISTVIISNTTISNNVSNNAIAASAANVFGGGIIIQGGGGTTTITNSTISGNSATISGAGATGAAFAGGIYNQQSTLTMTNSSVTNNSASNTAVPNNAFHGGIRTLAGTVAASTTLTNCTISGNTAVSEGGGIVNISSGAANSTTTITGSTISGNSATGATGNGGGIQNTAISTGLAVVNVTNSTVSGNSAANGGGSWNSGATATINYNFATIASNTSATLGGGLFQNTTGVTNLKNSIVADNTAPTGPDISGTITSQDYNHVEDVTGGVFFARSGKSKGNESNTFLLPNDVTGSDPQLGALANNGGTTLTHLPALASPVTNTIPNGTNDCGTVITTSQNSNTRPQGTGCEKGSAERVASTAANASIRGRVLTPTGGGIRNAYLILTNTVTGEVKSARTGSFGYFTFEDLPSGNFYILEVRSKRYMFNQTSFTLNEDLTDLVLTANP